MHRYFSDRENVGSGRQAEEELLRERVQEGQVCGPGSGSRRGYEGVPHHLQ